MPEQKPRPAPVERDGPDVAVAREVGAQLHQLAQQDLVDRVESLGPVEPNERDAVARPLDLERAERGHTRSITVAVPIPPPVHIVTRPVVMSRRSSSSRSVPMSIAPVAPIG